MGAARPCNLLDDLMYNVDSNVWAMREADGNVTVGLTAYACSLAGEIVSYTPKKVGKAVEKDKSCATVESGKWVGPVKTPVAGEVVVNEAVTAKPGTINQGPYAQDRVANVNYRIGMRILPISRPVTTPHSTYSKNKREKCCKSWIQSC